MAPAPVEVFRKDYTPTPYSATHVELKFDMAAVPKTVVTCTVAYQRKQPGVDLVLDGEGKPAEMELASVVVVGKGPIEASQYKLTDTNLTIPHALLPDEFKLEIVTKLIPEKNTSFSGLYKSSGTFCTQMEAEGFRNMTYFYDRPDVLCVYTTTVIGNKKDCPYLLSNGNPVAQGDMGPDNHFVTWDDPWPKPCYLFAVVAGDLACVEDSFVTMSGKTVKLRIFVNHGNEGRTGRAMDSLKKSMKWDEEVYGREYDLDLFNVVAVSDFNMGAMENKSLNIFNDRYVLGDPKTATDTDELNVERVIAHEYFHNWTGNRVTLRDWFQLTLKEGLTVFRDQSFSADMNSAAVKRIEDVSSLRAAQFREDAGPMAHPIRPESYISMDNFYTATVYIKGAEIIRMYHTILGPQGFRKGMDLYFERHDGGAVTCDDFLKAMEDANGIELAQFQRWYSQAGTPEISVTSSYDAGKKTMAMTFKQSYAPSPSDAEPKKPFDIPVALGFIGETSKGPVPVKQEGDPKGSDTKVIRVTKDEQTLTFVDVPEPVVPSILRNFSAPVKLTCQGQTRKDLKFLMAYDTDDFNRWEAGQALAKLLMLEGINGKAMELDDLVEAFKLTLADDKLDKAFVALSLKLPGESVMADSLPVGEADVDVIHEVRTKVVSQLVASLRAEFWNAYNACVDPKEGETSGDAVGRRALKNTCLLYLVEGAAEDPKVLGAAETQYFKAVNMTDQIGALTAIMNAPVAVQGVPELQAKCLEAFYQQWKENPLVVLKWLTAQAASPQVNVLAMEKLMAHEAFEWTNPNKVYAVLRMGFPAIPTAFHNKDGSGYKFLADCVLKLDQNNPQVAARVVSPFTQWAKFAPISRQEMMKREMNRMVAKEGLSKDVFELLSKSLK